MRKLTLYVDRGSALHRRHPLVKVAVLAAAFAAAFTMEEPFLVLPLAAAVAALLAHAGAAPNVRRLAPLFVGVPLTTLVVWSLFYGRGEPFGPLAALGVTREAIRYAVGMALKLETFLGASILFLSVTRVEEFTEALRLLGMPSTVAFTIALAFRLVPLFVGSALSVVDAQRSRGLDFERGGVLRRVRLYVPVIVPVFMGALRRADGMAIALEARGFGADRPRTTFPRSRAAPADYAAGAAIAAVVVLYFALWYAGYGKVVVR